MIFFKQVETSKGSFLGGGFKDLFHFHHYLGKTSKLTNMFQMAWFNHQPEKHDEKMMEDNSWMFW